MDVKQYREYIIKLTLMDLGLYSPEAEALILGTALQESGGLRYIRQLGDGPALGFIQMETATHNDIWKNFLKYKPDLAGLIQNASDLPQGIVPNSLNLVGNLVYGVAMCRAHYLRVRGAIPKTVKGQAAYWKKHYNTYLGKGTVDEYMLNWKKYEV